MLVSMNKIEKSEKSERTMDRHIGKRIKHRRIVLGIIRKDLAEIIGVSTQQLHKYEAAINRVSSSKLYNIAVALEVPVNYFFETLESEGMLSSSTLAENYEEEILEQEFVRFMQVYRSIKNKSVRNKIIELMGTFSCIEQDLATNHNK